MEIPIDADRLNRELEQLASFSDVPAPAVTRLVFSEADQQARVWLKERCLAAGLTIREDAVGNMFARWNSHHAEAPVIGTGSHIDAIPNAGRFDGTVGVLGALEAIRSLKQAGFEPRLPIELVLFTSEEPTRFGIGCLGSRLLSGALDPDAAIAFHDGQGASLDQLRDAAGFHGPLASVRCPPDYYSAFVELHIEQGPLLERAGIPIGLVTSIAAPASLRVVFEGEGGHAGAVLMHQRRDALTAAAEIILTVENLARATRAPDTVATTGVCNVFPGAVNSIPSRVTFEIDVRDTDLARRDSLVSSISATVKAVAERRKLGFTVELVNADAPANCDPKLLAALRGACREENAPFLEMVSRAYHDSLFMSRLAPTAMLFIPCRGGVSHRPDEFASPGDVALGSRVLARTLAALA
jgi:ureidoglycolate amidohydrolase